MDHALITAIVPVYNTEPALISRALDSLSRQTLRSDLMRTVVVDDASTDPETLEMLSSLQYAGTYRGVPVQVVRHDRNRWLAQARVTGARRARTPFVLFLDSDDFVDHDYLKKAVLLLASNEEASWAYPTTRCFGQYQESRPPAPFHPLEFFLRNRNPYASVYRRDAWEEVLQRERRVLDDVRFFEDWDTTIRLMARGHFGTPLADSTFHYRKRRAGLNDRTAKIYLLSIYTTWRANLLRAPLVVRSFLRHKHAQRKGKGLPSLLNPVRLVDRLQRALFQKALEMPEFDAVLDARSVLAGLAVPRRFIERFLDPERTITLAEIRCGFVRKPDFPPPVDETIGGAPNPRAALFAHTWWTIGGAENVLLEWMDSARNAQVEQVLDLTQLSGEENRDVKSRFEEVSDEQYCLARTGSTPRERLMFCWHLICHERPKLIVISGNACLYALTPYIKREFPETIIVDILHNEWRNRIDWFNVAHEYQTYIDYRIVISEHWRNVLVEKYREHPEKIRVHRNFVDTSRFSPPSDRREEKCKLRLDPERRVVSFIGRLHEQKNPEVFCEVAARFTDTGDIHFLVVGDGPLRDWLCDTYGHLPNLDFCGHSLQVEKYVAASDLVVFCSRYEGSPLGSLEAAAMKVPVIAPDIVGFREQITEGDFGLLYEPTGDPVADARRIADLIDNRYPDLKRRARAARDFVLMRHSRKGLKQPQVRRVEELLGSPRAPTVIRREKKRRLYLHIGWTKTGSTSIQHFLYQNRDSLRDLDVFYPTYLAWGYAHHILARCFIDGDMPEHVRERFPTWDIFRDRVHRHLDSLVEAPYSRVIFSSEAFRRSEPELIAEYLHNFDVRIILFLRRQDEWIEASANQTAKMRTNRFQQLHDADGHSKLLRRLPDYRAVLEKWSRAFGKQNISVVPFERSHFQQGLERHFLELVGAQWCSSLQPVARKNRRLNRDCLAYINEYPEQVRSRDPKFHRIISGLEAYSAENPDPPELKYILPPDVRLDILNQFRDDNDLIASEFLGNGAGRLFSDPEPSPSDPWTPYSGLSEDKRWELRQYLEQRGIAA